VLPKADLSIDEQKVPPAQNWCSSGHFAPTMFRRNGESKPEEPTRFFKVTSKGHLVAGIYCEPCLILANALVRGEITLKGMK
jgi:hypothetical protein